MEVQLVQRLEHTQSPSIRLPRLDDFLQKLHLLFHLQPVDELENLIFRDDVQVEQPHDLDQVVVRLWVQVLLQVLEDELFVVSRGYNCEGDCLLGLWLLRILLFVHHLRLLLLDRHPLVLLLLRHILLVLLCHLVWAPVNLQMIQVEPANELFPSQLECLLGDPVELLVMLDDLLDVHLELGVHLFGVHACLVGHFLDDVDGLGEYFWLVLLHEAHEVLNLLLLGFVDDHFVPVLHEGVELLGQLVMVEEGVVHLYEAIILILGLLVLPQVLGNVLVPLQVLVLQLVQPLLSLLNTYLFHSLLLPQLQSDIIYYLTQIN